MLKRFIFWLGITTLILIIFGLVEELCLFLASYFG